MIKISNIIRLLFPWPMQSCSGQDERMCATDSPHYKINTMWCLRQYSMQKYTLYINNKNNTLIIFLFFIFILSFILFLQCSSSKKRFKKSTFVANDSRHIMISYLWKIHKLYNKPYLIRISSEGKKVTTQHPLGFVPLAYVNYRKLTENLTENKNFTRNSRIIHGHSR